MSSSFDDSVAAPVHPSDDGFIVEDSSVLDTEEAIFVSGGELSPDQPKHSSFRSEKEYGTPFEEKELLNEIIDEAEEYKINFHSKRKITCDNNIASNRESEKVYVAARDKFHEEADKSYWKAIADLVPKEVAVIETRGSKKDQEKNPSVVVVQGPKPGKPTDLSRMRQILVKLKHNTPLHLKHSPPPPAAATTTTASAAPPAEAVAVA